MNSIPFDSYSKLRLLSPWRLRNDEKNLVVYTCNTDSIKHKILSPYEASIMPFFNGENSIEKIYDYWLDIHDATKDNITKLITSLNRIIVSWMNDKMIGTDGEVSPSVKYRRERLIPDFTSYIYPANRLERPLSVSVAITNHCNTNCLYCYAERRNCHELDFEKLNTIFRELAANEIYIVDIAGGDTLSHPDYLDIFKNMVKNDFVFFLSTKSYISEKTAETFRELEIGLNGVLPHLKRTLQISIDSSCPDIAAFLTGRGNYLGSAIASVKNAVKAGLSPRVKSVLTSFNADAPEGIVKLFVDLGVKEFQFVQYGRSHYRHNDSLFLSAKQKLEFADTAEKLHRDYPGILITFQEDFSTAPPKRKTLEDWRSRALCSGGRTSMQIQPNGDVTLCDQLPHAPQFIIGNVLEQGLKSVWNSPQLINFLNAPRELFNETVCYDCDEFDWCHYKVGYCYRDSFFHYGTTYDAPPDCPFQTKIGLRAL
ncbi:MAG: moaA/nifB/pqqE family protein [Firmicutes bacterium]|nr:moaA/nifB/pqqE family protein [Bacillota bacterium]